MSILIRPLWVRSKNRRKRNAYSKPFWLEIILAMASSGGISHKMTSYSDSRALEGCYPRCSATTASLLWTRMLRVKGITSGIHDYEILGKVEAQLITPRKKIKSNFVAYFPPFYFHTKNRQALLKTRVPFLLCSPTHCPPLTINCFSWTKNGWRLVDNEMKPGIATDQQYD